MSKVIIYPNPQTGHLALMKPVADCGIPIEEIAKKDVPAGLPYLLIDESDLPQAHEFFEAWEADFTVSDGQGIGAQSWFIQQFEAKIAYINNMQAPEKDDKETDKEYAALLESWNIAKANRIVGLNKMIAVQQAEMAA